jgi:hypothetical protein
MVLSFVLMRQQVEPFAGSFYLFAWYGLIFTVDRLIHRREGASLIGRCGWGFVVLLFWSAVVWFFFELLNFRLKNWYYVFVADHQGLRFGHTLLAFATVFPGIFWLAHYLWARDLLRSVQGPRLRLTPQRLRWFEAAGVLFLALPMLAPQYFFPLVWGTAILFLAPANYRCGLDGLLRQFERGEYGPTLRLLLAGLVAGLCWESFNFWARAKWIYTVPFFESLKLFEMPVAGFLGFPPFAVECGVIYRFLVWRGLAPAFGEYTQVRAESSAWPSKAVCLGLAGVFAVSVNYYMERMTVVSVVPRVEAIERLDAVTLERLRHHGIRYLTDLQGWQGEDRWRLLEQDLNAEQQLVLKALTRLFLYKGIGVEYGNLLVRAGIGSVEVLETLSARQVRRRLEAVAGGGPLPTLAQIRVWTRRV